MLVDGLLWLSLIVFAILPGTITAELAVTVK